MGKGPRRMYADRTQTLTSSNIEEQRALMLPICSPGTGNLLIAQHLPGDALYLQMPHVAQYLTRGGERSLVMLVHISQEATGQRLHEALCLLRRRNDRVMKTI